MRAKPLIWLGAVILTLSMLTIVACNTPAKTPEPNANGVITAEQWAEIYPDIYSSYQANSENSALPSYLQQNPNLVKIYDGSGFAKDYKEARGHTYSLQDLEETLRPHALANCLTCKTPEFTAIVNNDGVEVYSTPFEEIFAKISEPISCYTCHANTGDQIVISAGFLKDALGADASKVDPSIQACAQCHNEYYFDPTTKATTLPWSGLDKMTPDAILAYYNEIGFVDFTNTISGTGMIKVQHPEFETVTGAGNKMQRMGGLTCADCHMGTTTNAAGQEFTSHNWTSPLKNPELIEKSCKSCHPDLAGQVATIQKTITDREVAVSAKLAELHAKIGAAAANGSKTEAELTELRSTLRNAQFYWDFCFVENSEGAHNSTLAKALLDKAEQLLDAALKKF